MKLRKKFMFAFILLVLLPVASMGMISYWLYSNSMEKKTSDFYWISLQETDRKLAYAFSEINAISDLAVTQPVLQRTLKNGASELSEKTVQELVKLIMIHPKITSFTLLAEDQVIYSTLSDPYDAAIRNEDRMEQVRQMKGKPLWLGPGEGGEQEQGDVQPLLHIRTVKDYYSLEDIGVLLLTVKPEILDQVLWDASTLDQGDILLVNETGQVLFSKSGQQIGEKVSFPFIHEPTKDKYMVETFRGEESLITHLPSHREGWHVVASTPMEVIQGETRWIRNTAALLILLSLFTALLFDELFVAKLVGTMIRTVNGMKRVEQGHFMQVQSEGKIRDEASMLTAGFNRMSMQIKELLEQVKEEQRKKKEAEMQALVSQINPHFIYNSLESINSLAVLHDNKDISKMVISLGKLLRISISENQELIPLTMELEHVKHYLNIQKFRFGDKFDYTITIPPEMKALLSQKLIVQPIVENALYHGIEPIGGKGMIHIEVKEAGEDVQILVADNGPGMPLQQLETNFLDNATAKVRHKDGGVGLKNVHERTRIRFGSPYGIVVCSAPEFGTTISIRIPKIVS